MKSFVKREDNSPARSARTDANPSMMTVSKKLTSAKPTDTVNVKKIMAANIGFARSMLL